LYPVVVAAPSEVHVCAEIKSVHTDPFSDCSSFKLHEVRVPEPVHVTEWLYTPVLLRSIVGSVTVAATPRYFFMTVVVLAEVPPPTLDWEKAIDVARVIITNAIHMRFMIISF
jgi:hypothetical protein